MHDIKILEALEGELYTFRILALDVSKWLSSHPICFITSESFLITIESESEWMSESVWILWRQ